MLNRGIISNINDNCLLRHSPSLLRLTARSSSFLKPRYSRFQDPEVHWGLSPLCGQLLYHWIFLFLKILPYITRQVQNVLFFFFFHLHVSTEKKIFYALLKIIEKEDLSNFQCCLNLVFKISALAKHNSLFSQNW